MKALLLTVATLAIAAATDGGQEAIQTAFEMGLRQSDQPEQPATDRDITSPSGDGGAAHTARGDPLGQNRSDSVFRGPISAELRPSAKSACQVVSNTTERLTVDATEIKSRDLLASVMYNQIEDE